MWPFREKSDLRPPSEYALAAAKSLVDESARWKVTSDGRYLVHDSGIEIDTWNCWFTGPLIHDEPEANAQVLDEAIQKWISLTIAAPEPIKEKAVA